MALHGSKDVFVLVGGYDLTASKIKGLAEKDVSVVKDTTGVGQEWATQAPTGSRKAEFSQEGAFFDPDAGAAHEALKDLPAGPGTAPLVVCHGRAGMVIGKSFIGYEGVFEFEYNFVGEVEGFQQANPAYAVTGERERCRILQLLEAEAIDWDTESSPVDHTDDPLNRSVPITSSSVASPSIIVTAAPHGFTNGQLVLIAGHSGSTPDVNGEHVATVISPTTFSIPVNVTTGGTGGTVVQANTLAGGVGFLQVTALIGWTGLVVTIRDSADDIVYADLVAFANVTAAPASKRVTVTGTVDRFTAIAGVYSGGGPGSSTPFCGFKRNE